MELGQVKFEELCRYEVLLVIAGRLVALSLCLSSGKVTCPLDWRDLQLNGLAEVHFDDFLSVLMVCPMLTAEDDIEISSRNIYGAKHTEQFCKRDVWYALQAAWDAFIDFSG